MVKPDKLKDSAAVGTMASGAVATHEDVPRERAHFRALLVGNPNYFGNLADSPFAPVFALKGNTTYEEIKCAGFHPQANRLDAVVFVKQPFGYGGDVCSAGTQEYVRFYLSFDNGATWVDQGLTSFTAYNVPPGATGGRRLENAVSLPSSPPRRWCTVSNIILARAILSWNAVPPANTPDHIPVWGNVHDTHIDVDPLWIIKWHDFFKLSDITVTAALAESLDLDETVTAAPKKALAVAELQALYEGHGVEPHRYAMAEIKKLIKTPELTAGLPHPFYGVAAEKLGFKLSDVIAKLLATDGSTVYEELDCVGLQPNGLSNELVGIIRIKRSSGFSGGPCTRGSREYVTFWGDFNNNGTFETCLGTASVQVFDLDVPRQGLEYSVSLPVNLNPYRRRCEEGPRVVPIRAILSWNEVPDCGNPNWVPTWGNREETLILIPPGVHVAPGDFSPFLYDISGVKVCSIDQDNGLAAGDHPFGGTLCITGEIPGALDLAVPNTLEYKVTAVQGFTTLDLAAPFTVTVEEGTGPGTAVSYSIPQSAGPDGYFIYREHGTPALGAWRHVSSPNRLLVYWNTLGLSGTWTIHIQARVVGTVAPIYAAGTTVCLDDGSVRSSVSVTLDEQAPVAQVAIIGYTDASGFHPALPCGDFPKGVTINGTFDIIDNMGVGSYSLVLEPSGSVVATADPGSTATHVFGTWTVATGALDPCGYVVRLDASDRAIVNCGTSWHDVDTVGFCLRNPIV
jgi:hypothetical protein